MLARVSCGGIVAALTRPLRRHTHSILWNLRPVCSSVRSFVRSVVRKYVRVHGGFGYTFGIIYTYILYNVIGICVNEPWRAVFSAYIRRQHFGYALRAALNPTLALWGGCLRIIILWLA